MADPPDQRIKRISGSGEPTGSGGSADQVDQPDQRSRQPEDHNAGPERYCRIRGLVGSGAAMPRLPMNLIVEWFPIKINSFQGSGRHVF